jgi:hypothetical protein
VWDIAFLSPCLRQGYCHIGQHILNEDPVARGGIVYHHVGDRAHQLAVLDDTPIGASALCALGASHCVCPPRQTAEEQSAAFVLVSKLPDTNCLDYAGSLTGVWSSNFIAFQIHCNTYSK